MVSEKTQTIGLIEWQDLTVSNAESVRSFYETVVGWRGEGVSMGEYDDFNMQAAGSGETVAGICHARGPSQDMPAQWILYVRVEDVAQSVNACRELGGKVVVEPKTMGNDLFSVVEDPAGAVIGLISTSRQP